MHIRRHKVMRLITLALLVGTFVGCGLGGGDESAEQVEVVSVQRGALTVSITAVGSVSPRAEVRLSFGSGGEVSQVAVQAGERVEKGQALIQLDPRDLQLQVQSAQAALAAAQAQLEKVESGARAEEIAIAQANLDAAQAQLEGAQATLAELQKSPDENQVASANANVRAAQANVWLATIQSDQVNDGVSESEIAALQAQVASAQAQQKIARDAHDKTLECYTVTAPDGQKKEICPALGTLEEQARFNLYAADEALRAAQAQLEGALGGPDQTQRDSAQANLAAATAKRDAAQAQLDLLLAGSSAEQIQAAQANVAALTAQRDAAQAQLDQVKAGAAPADVALGQANVDQAQVALDVAELALERATLRAPFDGVISGVYLEPGQFAGPQVPAIALVDDSRFKIQAEVDEADVGWVQVGQEVQLTLDAFPTQELEGQVVNIAPAATLEAGVVSYQVTIEIAPTDLPLRGGLTVNAEIVTHQREDVLLVPNRAIWIDTDSGQPFVEKMAGEQIVNTVIEQGLTNEMFSQVLAGLDEGDQVVVRATSIRDRFRNMMTRSMSGE